MGLHMGLWTKEQLRQFIKENKLVTAQDSQNTLKDLFAETIQEMLEAEMDTHLGYDKHDVKSKQTTNSRNVKSRKTVTSEYGDQEIVIPRDRQGEFEPLVVKKHQSNVTDIEDQIVALYAKGVSTRDIQDHLANITLERYGHLDVWINNAGLMPLSFMNKFKVDEWNRMVDVNIKGVLNGIAHVFPRWKNNKPVISSMFLLLPATVSVWLGL